MTKLLAATALVVLGVNPAFAWGGKAHRMIGALAEKRLRSQNPAVLRAIEDLLGPGASLSEISTCADSLRDGLTRSSDNFPNNCLVTRQEAAAMFSSSASWHFINIPVPASPRKPDAHPNSVLQQACAANAPCVTQQIEYFYNRLRNKSLDNKTRAIALMILVHLVGDVHQPLHAVARNNDRGGNDVVVRIGRERRKLHAFWDSSFVDRLTEEDVVSMDPGKQGNPKQWAWESYDLARHVVYRDLPERPSSMEQPIELPSSYRENAIPVVKRRIYAASVRLANLLAKALAA